MLEFVGGLFCGGVIIGAAVVGFVYALLKDMFRSF